MFDWIVSHKAFFSVLLVNFIGLLNGVLPFVPAGNPNRNWLGKTMTVLRWLLDLLAPTAAKDSPHTVKMPLTWSKPPVNGAPKIVAPDVSNQKGAVRIDVILGLLGVLAIMWIVLGGVGCCYFSGSCKKAVDDCAAPEIRKDVANTFALVVDLLEHGTGNLDTELNTLAAMGVQSGMVVITCVIQQYLGQPQATATA